MGGTKQNRPTTKDTRSQTTLPQNRMGYRMLLSGTPIQQRVLPQTTRSRVHTPTQNRGTNQMNRWKREVQRYELLIQTTRRQLARQSSDKTERIQYLSRYLSDLYDCLRLVRQASEEYERTAPKTRPTTTKGEYDEQ